ncbi:bacillithiol system redox-active protein YtxJ [Robertkochia sediminum]|uniref:bacillithiol system redox-active protein YtxJ n=1 Tax=Robertkochia sediminum TaxID=2785326 RepID=UPI001F1D2C53|nr:bacillithiol system redox-active protein YtxJ [Robertkochia sediminum]
MAMKWLGSIFDGKGEDENAFPWHQLTELSQLEAIQMESFQRVVLIYKHSTRCGISSVVLSRMERSKALLDAGISCYFLDLIRYRSLSNKIADAYGIRHESPQVLLLSKGKVLWHGSHGAITAPNILEQL